MDTYDTTVRTNHDWRLEWKNIILHSFLDNRVVLDGCVLNLGVTSFVCHGIPGMKEGRWKKLGTWQAKSEEDQYRN